jgi:hypothetical protein
VPAFVDETATALMRSGRHEMKRRDRSMTADATGIAYHAAANAITAAAQPMLSCKAVTTQ